MDPGKIKGKPPEIPDLKPTEPENQEPTKTKATPAGVGESSDSIETPQFTKFDKIIKQSEQKATDLPQNLQQADIKSGVLGQKINVAEPACSGTLMSTCGVPDTDPNVCDTLSGCPSKTDLGSLPRDLTRPADLGGVLGQKINVGVPACSTGLLSTCGVPDTDPNVCDTLSGCPSKIDLGSLPLDRSRPGDLGGVLGQKINVAEPACSGTLMSTCGVPDTDPSFCDTLSGCPSKIDLGSVHPDLSRPSDLGGVLGQKINVAEPACSGTLMSTCGVPDTDPSFCDTLSGCPTKIDLGSLPLDLSRPSDLGGILGQKINVAAPACEGTLMSTCGVPDTDPNFCDTLSGCPTKTDLGSLPRDLSRPADLGGVLGQKINVGVPACSTGLLSTCGVPDTDPSICDTLSGCPKP